MKDYVSDSDTELESIPVTRVSQTKLQDNLSVLDPEQRNRIAEGLRSLGYGQLLISTHKNHGSSDSASAVGDQRNNGTSSNENANVAETGIFYNEIDNENESLQDVLLSLIPLSNPTSGRLRRGLRKRNFASTHPYLADQAHWLGLASVDYLNDIYEENQDLEAMVKLLNQQYLIKKRKYPNEDRYKSKSFYKYLGRSNPNAINNEQSKNERKHEVLHHMTEIVDKNRSDDSDYESENSDIRISKHKHTHIHDSDDNNESLSRSSSLSTLGSLIDINELQNEFRHRSSNVVNDEDISLLSSRQPLHSAGTDSNEHSSDETMDKEDQMVRVGGRFRNEKTVLRGVLPESAKRLDIYTSRKRTHSSKVSKKPAEKRRGLARKKKGIPMTRSLHSTKFLDEGDLYVEGVQDESDANDDFIRFHYDETKEDVSEILDASNAFDSKYRDYISLSSASEPSSDIESVESDSISKSFSGNDSRHEPVEPDKGSIQFEMNQNFDEPEGRKLSTTRKVYDRPEIDPDMVGTSKKNSIKTLLSSGKRSSRQAAFPKFSRFPKNSRFSKQKSATRPLHRAKSLPKRSLKRGVLKPLSSSQPRIFSFGSIPNSLTKAADEKKVPRESNKALDPSNLSNLKNDIRAKNDAFPQQTLSTVQYKKEPNYVTTVFEAESNRKFVKSNKFSQISNNINSTRRHGKQLLDVGIEQLHCLNQGYFTIPISDVLVCHLNGNRYAFNLVNKSDSINSSQNLLLKIAKLINMTDNSNSLADINGCVKVLIYWQLVLQKEPSMLEWKYTRIILQMLIKKDSDEYATLFSYLIVLFFVLWKISERRTGFNKHLRMEFCEYCGFFWHKIFYKIHEESEYQILVLTNESISFIWRLLVFDMDIFWETIEFSVKKMSFTNPELYLEGLFYISNELSSKDYNWNCFYLLYDNAKGLQVSTFFKNFLDVCFLLNQRKSWPLQEKLIMKLYGSITSRKFFNFEDESLNISMLTKIYTINDIPNGSFFECFMQFLYYYVSGLNETSQIKRLATKLLASSHYQYEKGKPHQVAFTNRFNFVILLSQISTLNQNSLVLDLIRLILDSNDVDIYLIAIKQLRTYSEIVSLKKMPLTTEAFILLTEKLALLYLTVPGISKVIVQLCMCLQRSYLLDSSHGESEYLFEFFKVIGSLSLKNFHDDFSAKVVDLLLPATTKLLTYKNILVGKSDVINSIIVKVKSFISKQMGRLPMKSRFKEGKSVGLIEKCFEVWIILSFINDPNWNKILFQDFPYMGNSYSREMFVLCLFCNILQFDPLAQHMDILIETLLKQISRLNTSPYIFRTINSMKKLNVYITDFKKIHLNRNITEVELSTNKLQIILTMISNIIDRNTLKQNKTHLLKTFMEALNDEYDKCFLSNRFVESSKRIIEFLQLHSIDFVVNLSVYQELSNKLGITPISSNQIRWKGLPQLEQLSFLNKELISCVIYKRDIFATLDQYANSSSLNVIYHLVSIYMKNVANNQVEFWMMVSHLLDYLIHKMEIYRIDFSSREFGKFLLLLKDMTSLFFSRGTRFVDVLRNYQLKSLYLTYILLKRVFFIYDGFKDQKFIIDVVDQQFLDYSYPTTNRVTELENSYSAFRYYDISNNYKESLGPIESDLMKPDYERFDPFDTLMELRRLMSGSDENENSSILDFDF